MNPVDEKIEQIIADAFNNQNIECQTFEKVRSTMSLNRGFVVNVDDQEFLITIVRSR